MLQTFSSGKTALGDWVTLLLVWRTVDFTRDLRPHHESACSLAPGGKRFRFWCCIDDVTDHISGDCKPDRRSTNKTSRTVTGHPPWHAMHFQGFSLREGGREGCAETGRAVWNEAQSNLIESPFEWPSLSFHLVLLRAGREIESLSFGITMSLVLR